MPSGSGFPHFAISLPPTAPDRKSNSNSRIAGYIRQLPGSPLPSRHPPLQHLPHHHTPPAPPPLKPGSGFREVAAPPEAEKELGRAARRRHGGRRFPRPASLAAIVPPCPGGPNTPGSAAPAAQRPRYRSRQPVGRCCSPWWRMAMDSPRQIRAKQVAPRMAATRAEEIADVNTRLFIGRRRLGGSADPVAEVGPSNTVRRRVDALSPLTH